LRPAALRDVPGEKGATVDNRVIILGLDGATFELLDPWLDAGRLPNLKRMIDEGVRGELESCVPPVTAPAWTSFFTGKNPGKHGVFDFVRQDRESYEFHPVNSGSYHGKSLWEVIGDQGRNVVVLNVPMTHPAYPVKGALVSDFLLATTKGERSHPPELLGELEKSFGPYPTETVPPYFAGRDSEEDIGRFLQEYQQAMQYKLSVAQHFLEKDKPDFLMLHLFGNDQICHWLWHLMDDKHPKYREAESKKHLERIHEYYRTFDLEVGNLMDRTDEEVSLFIVSDHGFGPVHRSIDFNTWLYKEGYLALKRRPSSRLRHLAWRMGLTPQALMDRDWFLRLAMGAFVRLKKKRSRGNVDDLKQAHALMRLFLSFQDIDWSRTRAFSPFGFGQIRINLRGQWSQGCVSEGLEYENTRKEIVEKLRALKDPDTGEVVDGVVSTKEEIYRGDLVAEAPDILFVPTHGKYRPKSTGFSSKNVFASSGWMTGIHKMNGVLIGRGKPLKRGQRLEDLRITDVFPSVLGLMGLEIPEDVDGRIPDQLFTDEFLQAHPVRRGPASSQTKKQPTEEDGREEDGEVMDRLKSLGYLE
jgi:predicted AlkP superfamily phosphohydrolase/phosphomutase